MKKIILTLAGLFVAVSASAQTWGVGGRIGSGLQAVGEYKFENGNYIEARFGMGFVSYNGLTADFMALYQWNVLNMDWTPNAGKWSLDAGAGVNVGGRAHYVYTGVAGSVKLGFTFKKSPLKLAADFTPALGVDMTYGDYVLVRNDKKIGFNAKGFANVGVSCVYYF